MEDGVEDLPFPRIHFELGVSIIFRPSGQSPTPFRNRML